MRGAERRSNPPEGSQIGGGLLRSARSDNRFPGYSTLAKRDTPSWNAQTRAVVDKRLNEPPPHRFFTDEEWALLVAICARIIPQPTQRDRNVPIAPFIDRKMAENHGDGFQQEGLPGMQRVWRRGLSAIDAEASLRFGAAFIDLPAGRQDEVLHMVQQGDVRAPAWADLPAQQFFKGRLLIDIVTMYYAHPQAWDEIGFGGPASPRGYVRMGFDRYDPWEAPRDAVEHA